MQSFFQEKQIRTLHVQPNEVILSLDMRISVIAPKNPSPPPYITLHIAATSASTMYSTWHRMHTLLYYMIGILYVSYLVLHYKGKSMDFPSQYVDTQT